MREEAFEDFVEDLEKRHPADGPRSVTLELTYRCNLRCRHCYMVRYRDEPELTTDEVLRLLDELAAMGTLSLLMTGGEPLLRPDFLQLWEAAKRRGFLLTLFTNATLVTDRVLDLLKDLPPLLTEVSLYGASRATYAAVTGSGEAFDRTCRGMEKLRTLPSALHVKAPILRRNLADLPAMARLAAEWDVPFYHDTEVFPRLDGDPAPLVSAIPPMESVQAVATDPMHIETWEDEANRPGLPARLDHWIVCRGGERSMHIGPFGDMCLCMLLREPSRSLRHDGLANGWFFLHNEVRGRRCRGGRPCASCEALPYCVPCAGKNRLATGNPETPSPYLCERSRAIATVLRKEPMDERTTMAG